MPTTRNNGLRGTARTPSPKPSDEANRTVTKSRPHLRYAKALSTSRNEEEDVFVDPDAETTTSFSSAISSKRSKSPVKRVVDLQNFGGGIYFCTLSSNAEALGSEGRTLFYNLSDMASGIETIPESLWDTSPEFQKEFGRKPHESHFYTCDTNIDDLHQEFAALKKLVQESMRCHDEVEPECEWNHAVHSGLLSHILSKRDGPVGFRSTMSERINPEWLSKHPSGLTGSRMFDFGWYLHGDDTTQARLTKTSQFWGPSVNSFNRPSLTRKLVPFLIETKTISRPEEEARIQLGICIWSQIERLKSMARNSPAAQSILKEMIFPLSYVNGARWTFMFARIDSADYSKTVIHMTTLQSDTSNIVMAYRTVVMLRRLETFLSSTFCGWWNDFLDKLE